MRRSLTLGVVIAALVALAMPAGAHSSEGGRVLLSTGNPAVAKAEYNSLRRDGITGKVIKLHAGADDQSYTLTTVHGLTGAEEFDAWFFEDDGGKPGVMCGTWDNRQHGAVESGRICPNHQVAAWAVIVLFTGADGRFVFSY